MKRRLIIVKDALSGPTPSTSDSLIISFEELKEWLKSGVILRHVFRFRETELWTHRNHTVGKPFLSALLLRVLSRRTICFRDGRGERQEINTLSLLRLLRNLCADFTQRAKILSSIDQKVRELSVGKRCGGGEQKKRLYLSGRPAYLRTDLWVGVLAGGSVGHIAGVLNNMDRFTGRPVLLTTADIPTVHREIEKHVIPLPTRFWDYRELPQLVNNMSFEENAKSLLGKKRLSFIYQRYSLNNYTGLKLADLYKIPFVLEYNGSEIWINRQWGRRLKYEALAERIEMLNLEAADLVVVVSRPMRDELIDRGVDAAKILVNPNGVDVDRYSPTVDGAGIRAKYDLAGKTVVGFIGTFGKWHGAEVLAEAFGQLLKEEPEYRGRVRLLMIGDGVNMPEVRRVLRHMEAEEECFLTGMVPQKEGAIHLAACDILASPHVPNPDGTPFFGSPTKLFEYMAMGKGIVASRLDQIGEVLEAGRTGHLVDPGDVTSLKLGIKTLIDEEDLRKRLGEGARREVVEKYTWTVHTGRIIEKLADRCELV